MFLSGKGVRGPWRFPVDTGETGTGARVSPPRQASGEHPCVLHRLRALPRVHLEGRCALLVGDACHTARAVLTQQAHFCPGDEPVTAGAGPPVLCWIPSDWQVPGLWQMHTGCSLLPLLLQGILHGAHSRARPWRPPRGRTLAGPLTLGSAVAGRLEPAQLLQHSRSPATAPCPSTPHSPGLSTFL